VWTKSKKPHQFGITITNHVWEYLWSFNAIALDPMHFVGINSLTSVTSEASYKNTIKWHDSHEPNERMQKNRCTTIIFTLRSLKLRASLKNPNLSQSNCLRTNVLLRRMIFIIILRGLTKCGHSKATPFKIQTKIFYRTSWMVGRGDRKTMVLVQ